ncbi:uncharacterized protein [Prorops nasuta]|uniref:uncharacterized protein n=1 Tax=Prorops nasuta TaxID=863751 RepID=UPI0034CDF0DB
MAPASKTLISQLKTLETDMKFLVEDLRGRAVGERTSLVIKARSDSLIVIWDKIRLIYSELVAKGDEIATEFIDGNGFLELRRCFNNVEEELTVLRETQPSTSSSDASLSTPASVSEATVMPNHARLPQVDLPTFSGRFEKWDSFYDLFDSLIHQRSDLSDAVKLQYLKTCLTGEAAAFVRGTSLKETNYVPTWIAIKARYANPRVLAFIQIRELIDMPPLKRESALELRTFIDKIQRIVRALKSIGLPVEHWDQILIGILSRALDPESRRLWAEKTSVKEQTVLEFSTFSEFIKFLKVRASSLVAVNEEEGNAEGPSTVGKAERRLKTRSERKAAYHVGTSRKGQKANTPCRLCSSMHGLVDCDKFVKEPIKSHLEIVRRLRLCFKCFLSHFARDCKAMIICKVCRGKHHYLLHRPAKSDSNNEQVANTGKQNEGSETVQVLNVVTDRQSYEVILATAQVALKDVRRNIVKARALLDQGSEGSFVSEALVQLLELPKQRASVSLVGVGSSSIGTVKSQTDLNLYSTLHSSFQVNVKALVLHRVTPYIPKKCIVNLDLEEFKGLELADPCFWKPDSIDLILGVDIYGQLIKSGVRRLTTDNLVAQNSHLGWIVSGTVQEKTPRRAVKHNDRSNAVVSIFCTTDLNLLEALKRFWVIEEIPNALPVSPDDEYCEKHFMETHTRDSSGRYIVKLSIQSSLPVVALSSRSLALTSLRQLHGHMVRVPPVNNDCPRTWYLPHHAVTQESNCQWKLRVVFDASRRVYVDHCLNRYLYAGPTLQSELPLTLLQWRQHRFVFTADLVKMFRQIRVDSQDQELQRIVWAKGPNEPLIDYKFTTVTYGTACAPFLAICTLMQLAHEHKSRYPLGFECLLQNTYVDDIFAGDYKLDRALLKRDELCGLLKTAGIELSKWAVNHIRLKPGVESSIPVMEGKLIGDREDVKTLGVRWRPTEDHFYFTVRSSDREPDFTMRGVMSAIARLFDPLGWLAPVIVKAKIILQDLWILKCDLDTPLPPELISRWEEYTSPLSGLKRLNIYRWLGTSSTIRGEIHGFSDASVRAYAAAIFLRVQREDGSFLVSLLIAKSKVSPVKTISVPKLELNGAALLVKLIRYLLTVPAFKELPIFAWTDSQITELPSATWRHVKSKENSADLATRGLTSLELAESVLWWHGPHWLSALEVEWPEQASLVQVSHTRLESKDPELITCFSSFTRLLRVTAYCLRPLSRIWAKKAGIMVPNGSLTVAELAAARVALIRIVQLRYFSDEITKLSANNLHSDTEITRLAVLSKNHPLSKLRPYVPATCRRFMGLFPSPQLVFSLGLFRECMCLHRTKARDPGRLVEDGETA